MCLPHLNIINSSFILHFQPQYEIVDDKLFMYGAEALIRMHSVDGLIYPDAFIPIYEQNGNIQHLGKFVIHEGLSTLQKWGENKHTENLSLSINISPIQLLSSNFLYCLNEALSTYKFNKSNLILEITESIPMNISKECIKKLETIKSYGVRLSLDDFGTEFSSLKSLLTLPIDEVKIDRFFISKLASCCSQTETSIEIVNSISKISKTTNSIVLAEGVETIEEFKILKKMGIINFQGYLFSKPIKIEDINSNIKENGLELDVSPHR